MTQPVFSGKRGLVVSLFFYFLLTLTTLNDTF